VKKLMAQLVQRLAPRTVTNLRALAVLDEEFNQGPERFLNYEREIARLRRDIDELRRDHRRVAELYDVVFESARARGAAHGGARTDDASTVDARVAAVIADESRRSADNRQENDGQPVESPAH